MIIRELQVEADRAVAAAASGRVTPQFSGGSPGGAASGIPISPSIEVNNSPLYASGPSFSSAPGSLRQGYGYNDGDPLSAQLAAAGMHVDDSFGKTSSATRIDALGANTTDWRPDFGTTPTSAYPSATYPTNLSHSPFQYGGPSDLSFFDPTSSFNSSTAGYPAPPGPSFGLPSPTTGPSSSGTGTPLLAGPVHPQPDSYNPADLAAAFERMAPSLGQQLSPDWQQTLMVPPADGRALYAPLRERASSSSLPRLVTQDLSGGLALAGSEGPGTGTSGSTLAPPECGVARPRSRSHGAQDRPGQFADLLSPTTAGSHRRGSSAGSSHSQRFHPFSSPGASPILGTSPTPSFDGGMFGSSSTGQDSSASASGSNHRRSKSASHPSRTERTLAYNPTAVFYTNTSPVFAIHLQNSTKAEVSERDLIELVLASEAELAEAPMAADGSRAPTNEGTGLWAAAYGGQDYDAAKRAEDARAGRTYTFVSAPPEGTAALRLPDATPPLEGSLSSPANPPPPKTYWLVSYSPEHPNTPSIVPLVPNQRTAFSPTLTFLHFPPGMVTLTAHPFGSKEFWRVQSCPGRHDKQPGDGSWTSRWDGEGEERRPSRILLHFATCGLRKGEEEEFALGRLARAIRSARGKGA